MSELSKLELKTLIEGFQRLNDPDQGMNYSGGHSGERRFDERTGEPYWTRGRPPELTVYSDRARFLYDVIQKGKRIAELLAKQEETA